MCWQTLIAGRYVWNDGSAEGYYNWHEGEPNGGTSNENCVELLVPGGKWNDIFCDYQNGYVCRKRQGNAECFSFWLPLKL